MRGRERERERERETERESERDRERQRERERERDMSQWGKRQMSKNRSWKKRPASPSYPLMCPKSYLRLSCHMVSLVSLLSAPARMMDWLTCGAASAQGLPARR